MNHPAPEVHEALAEVLAAHERVPGNRSITLHCRCGWESGDKFEGPLEHRTHLASVLADHFAEDIAAAATVSLPCDECDMRIAAYINVEVSSEAQA